MGFFSGLLSAAAPIAGSILGGPAGGAIGGALGGLLGSKGSPSSAMSTSQQQIDPRMDNMLWGADGKSGLLNQYQSMLNTPQSQPLQQYGNTAGAYLNNFGASDMNATHNAATNLIGGNAAPQVGAPAWAVGNQVQAPSQNNIDLSGTFNGLLGGGNNTALKDSLQYGTSLTGAQFQKNQTDLTNNLQRNILPGIRSNSVLAGQYGGSRQGIAEGNALSDYTNQLTNANTQLGLANSANTTGQLANSYEQGQNRALSAAQGLSAQQYGTALQNANTKNQAEFMNVGQVQQNNLANQSAQLQTNAQNNSSALAGAGLLGGQTNAAYGAATNNQNYALNQAQGVNSLLAPYLNANKTTTDSRPLYQSTAGNLLGGALAGGQLASQFGGLLGGGGPSSLTYTPSSVDNYHPSATTAIPSLPFLSNFNGG